MVAYHGFLNLCRANDGSVVIKEKSIFAKLYPETQLWATWFQNYCKVNGQMTCCAFFSIKSQMLMSGKSYGWTG